MKAFHATAPLQQLFTHRKKKEFTLQCFKNKTLKTLPTITAFNFKIINKKKVKLYHVNVTLLLT